MRYLQELNQSRVTNWSKRIVASSKKMQDVKDLVYRCSQVDSTILICGESGTGKEVIANMLYESSKRKDCGPFIKINCAAIPEQLLESELFGYEGGTFTGARQEGKAGVFELADKGTLFLDEIAELFFRLSCCASFRIKNSLDWAESSRLRWTFKLSPPQTRIWH